MPNPGAFQGTRHDFLTAQMPLYAAAVNENHIADTVADIQRRYFKRYPISLPHNVEPSAEWLAQVDDNAADDELVPPDESLLDEDAFNVAQAEYDEQVKTLKFRRGQIARRLNYQHSKTQTSTKRAEIGSEDPMVILLAKIAGIPLKKPRIRTAWNVWGQNNRDIVDPIYDQRVEDENVPNGKRAALRLRIYKECFEALGEEEKKDYERRAVEEHAAAVAKVEEALNAPPSQNPDDRQRILGEIPGFIQPILDLITDYTGWKATLLIGGPEPADHGRLNVMSFHSGETSGNVKMNFGRSERRAYKEYVMPVFGNFLKKCYTVEECRAAALSDPTMISLAEILRVADGDEFNVDSAEGPASYARTTRTPSGGREGSLPSTPMLPTTYVAPSIRLQKVRALSRPANTLSTPITNAPLNMETPLQQAVAPIAEVLSPAPTRALPGSANTRSACSRLNSERVLIPEVTSQHAAAALDGNHPDSRPPSPNLSVAASCVPSPRASPMPGSLPMQVPHVSPTCKSSTPVPCASPIPSRALTLNLPDSPILAQPTSPSMLLPATPARQISPTPAVNPLRAGTEVMLRDDTSSSTVLDTRKRRRSTINAAEENMGSSTCDDAPKKRLRSSRAPALQAAGTEITHTPRAHAVISATTSPLTSAELAGSPEWFLKAYQMLISQDLGPKWMQLVRAWAHFEKVERYEEKAKLGTAGRPACVSAWIARARSARYRPDLGKLPLFEKAFNRWWVGLQPEWRVENGKVLKMNAGDFEDLRRPGKNGLLSVLAALFFWGAAAEKDGIILSKPWMTAVDDIYWVIENLSPK